MNPKFHSAIRRISIPSFTFEAKRDPSFDFDEVKHEYRLNGAVIIGATSVLRRCGWVDGTYYTEASRLRGTWVHQAIHYSEEGDLKWDDKPEWIQGYLDAHQRFREDWQFTARLREVPLYHPQYLYGVMPDAEGLILGKEPAIVEYKTGQMQWWTKYQTALQELAIRAWETNPVWRRRFGVELHADGTYKVQEFKTHADYARAHCAVVTVQCNENKPRKEVTDLLFAP